MAEIVESEENSTNHMRTLRVPPVITINKSAAYALYELTYIRVCFTFNLIRLSIGFIYLFLRLGQGYKLFCCGFFCQEFAKYSLAGCRL